jgi:hypothetical protein
LSPTSNTTDEQSFVTADEHLELHDWQIHDTKPLAERPLPHDNQQLGHATNLPQPAIRSLSPMSPEFGDSTCTKHGIQYVKNAFCLNCLKDYARQTVHATCPKHGVEYSKDGACDICTYEMGCYDAMKSPEPNDVHGMLAGYEADDVATRPEDELLNGKTADLFSFAEQMKR